MKTIWISDSSTISTGYGRVAKETLPLWVKLGHDVGHIGKQYMGNPIPYDGYSILGNWTGEIWHSVQNYVTKDIDCISGVMDLHWLNPGVAFLNKLRADKARTKLLLYFPIDGYPLAGSHYENLKLIDYPVVFSHYASAAMKDMGYKLNESFHYVPHGVNTQVFRPLGADARADLRNRNGMADKFVVGSTNRNNYRKMLPRLLHAFSIFAKEKPDALLMLHCDPQDSQGYNLPAWVKRYGIEDKVRFTGIRPPMVGFDDAQLNNLYNCFDVLATASTGEGFGLPIIEAQAAGVPVIGGDHTAQTELIRGHGWLVGTQDTIPTHDGLEYYSVSVESLVAQLEDAYGNFARRKSHAIAARKFAEGYDWQKVVMPEWQRVLDQISEKEGWQRKVIASPAA